MNGTREVRKKLEWMETPPIIRKKTRELEITKTILLKPGESLGEILKKVLGEILSSAPDKGRLWRVNITLYVEEFEAREPKEVGLDVLLRPI